MIETIIQALWIFLPAALANATAPLVKKINFLKIPVDLGNKFRAKRIFGENKTYRGFFFGIIVAIVAAFLQSIPKFQTAINYSDVNVIMLGFLLGFGALCGDLIESFFKRQLNIKPGKPLPIFDQIDWIIGANLFLAIYLNIPWNIVITSIIVYGLLHPIINLTGYALKLQKNKF